MIPRLVSRTSHGTRACFRPSTGTSSAVSSPLSSSAHWTIARNVSTSSSSSSSSARKSSYLYTVLGLAIVGGSSYLLGSIYPPTVISMLFTPPGAPRLRHDSVEAKTNAESIESSLQQLAFVVSMKSQSLARGAAADLESGTVKITTSPFPPPSPPSSSSSIEPTSDTKANYIMTRPYLRYDLEKAQHNLTAGSLRGPGMIAVPPLVFTKTVTGVEKTAGSEGDATIVIHLGRSLCGHDGIVHGGMLATLLDEALARTAIYHLEGKVGVTANLEINYRKPTIADQFIVIQTELIEKKGRKSVVQAKLTDLNGTVLVDAKALFVQPKYAKYLLNAKAIQQVLEG